MNKPTFILAEFQKLHHAGHLDEAEQGYKKCLDQNPNDVMALHLLGVLYAEKGNLEDAELCLKKAISIQPGNSALYLHLATILKAKGSFNQAIQILLQLIHFNPHFAAAFNNLGTLFYSQEKWQEAVASYQEAIALQADYADAYYNLGLALIKLNRRQEATNVYYALIELRNDHPGARFQLGCLLMNRNHYQAAIEHFYVLEQMHPYHFETQSNLATCYLKLGNMDKAKLHYLKALEIIPEDIQILYNLGVINMQQGLWTDAIHYYLQVLKINPEHYESHNNLGVIYLATKNTEKALWHFRAALRQRIDDEAVRHTISILMRDKTITHSPPAYIRALFDSYAEHFDTHLKESLHYQLPLAFHDLLKTHYTLDKPLWKILDLGCGTGLCGELLRSAAREIIGVDLSEKMLAKAAEKNIYDKLIQADILLFLENTKAKFDLIVAGDVLVYFGDLSAIFFAVYSALSPNGLFIFNAEINEENDHMLSDMGRFKHRKAYLDRLITQHGFILIKYQILPLRTENNLPVLSHVYLIKK